MVIYVGTHDKIQISKHCSFDSSSCCPSSFVFIFALGIENLLLFDVRIGVYELSNFT